jgi:peptidoglycan biosynthesis protein MviN/MurJ (putative lipid II flippase)
MSISVFKNLDASCPSSTLRDGWALIQALGACMVAAGASYFICVMINRNCYSQVETVRTGEVYFGIFGVFSLVIVGICASMLKEYGDISDKDKANCDDTKNTTKRLTMFVTIMSSMGVLFTGGYLIKLHFDEKIEV